MDQLGQLAQWLLDGIGLLVSGLAGLLGLIARLLGLDPVPGFLDGIAAMALLAFVVFRVSVWGDGASSPFKPQKIVHSTSKTPFQVMTSGCMNMVVLGLVALIVGLLIYGILVPAP